MKSSFITSVICGLVTINAVVSADAARPRLVVGIVVDQLRTDYLEYLREMFGEEGFRTLMKRGIYMRDVDFRNTVADPVAATALIQTGAWPANTGVPTSSLFSTSAKRNLPTLHDTNFSGVNTTETYSPVQLRLSTVTDEIVIDGAGLGAHYSVATDPQQAVILAGHAARSAVWLSHDGLWASSSYYPDFPQSVNNRNRLHPTALRLDTLQWKPSLRPDQYPGVPAQKRYYPFRHTFPLSDRDVYTRYRKSAPANEEVTDIAIEILKNQALGKRGDAIDVLNVAYTAAPYKYVKDGDYRIELEDTYLRLDTQLGRLLNAIATGPGLDNTLIYLTSTGYYDDATVDDPKYRIPTGDFSSKRAESLLNSYLSAKHGNADFVEAVVNGRIYLDHKEIEKRNADRYAILNDARDFLRKMSGVKEVYTLSDILTSNLPDTEALRLRTDSRSSGDLFLTFQPGWNVIDDQTYPPQTYPQRQNAHLSPAFIMAPTITATTIDTPVEATAIAPTVTSTLHIRSPNGASTRPVTQILTQEQPYKAK